MMYSDCESISSMDSDTSKQGNISADSLESEDTESPSDNSSINTSVLFALTAM